jgi:hypothetical protein
MDPQSLVYGRSPVPVAAPAATGRLVLAFGEPCYVIDDVDRLPPFLVSVVSDADHWLFVASSGALTAGRGGPATALFPYVTEDKIYDAVGVTGPVTALVVTRAGQPALWRPLRDDDRLAYRITRRLYKNLLGNRLVFEEDNHDLALRFRAEWQTSARFGFVRTTTIENRGDGPIDVRVLDGLHNLLPGDVSEPLQQSASCLIDAFKVAERIPGTTLALYTLAAQVIDRAEPLEALHATTVWSHGLPTPEVILVADEGRAFERGHALTGAELVRGRRGAYLAQAELTLAAGASHGWMIVADVAQTQPQVAALVARLRDPAALAAEVRADVAAGAARLTEIVAATDGLQCTADRLASAHHLANVLFNDMRGGVFAFGVDIPGPDFAAFVRDANREVWRRHRALLDELPARAPRAEHQARIDAAGDPELTRLAAEYLPLTFSRRHGDPSRPWNRFAIRVRDDRGELVLDYQGNWRDIFQNWEALGCTQPEFLEQMVAKFVNASTVDGHNPYRIGRAGIDWEVPEPDHPWATIGYWGDHQIVYLTRLLELARAHHPTRLSALLIDAQFAYAEVPYRLRPFTEIVADPRSTIEFDHERHGAVSARAADLGSDGRLLHDAAGVYRVNLIEKLLVSALAKLANFVPGGGIWMNTQRPEWNDANNALVGYGVSTVTACYLERYLALLPALLAPVAERSVVLSREVAAWLAATAAVLARHRGLACAPVIDDTVRGQVLTALGTAASDYRAAVYAHGFTGRVEVAVADVLAARRWRSSTRCRRVACTAPIRTATSCIPIASCRASWPRTASRRPRRRGCRGWASSRRGPSCAWWSPTSTVTCGSTPTWATPRRARRAWPSCAPPTCCRRAPTSTPRSLPCSRSTRRCSPTAGSPGAAGRCSPTRGWAACTGTWSASWCWRSRSATSPPATPAPPPRCWPPWRATTGRSASACRGPTRRRRCGARSRSIRTRTRRPMAARASPA